MKQDMHKNILVYLFVLCMQSCNNDKNDILHVEFVF